MRGVAAEATSSFSVCGKIRGETPDGDKVYPWIWFQNQTEVDG